MDWRLRWYTFSKLNHLKGKIPFATWLCFSVWTGFRTLFFYYLFSSAEKNKASGFFSSPAHPGFRRQQIGGPASQPASLLILSILLPTRSLSSSLLKHDGRREITRLESLCSRVTSKIRFRRSFSHQDGAQRQAFLRFYNVSGIEGKLVLPDGGASGAQGFWKKTTTTTTTTTTVFYTEMATNSFHIRFFLGGIHSLVLRLGHAWHHQGKCPSLPSPTASGSLFSPLPPNSSSPFSRGGWYYGGW